MGSRSNTMILTLQKSKHNNGTGRNSCLDHAVVGAPSGQPKPKLVLHLSLLSWSRGGRRFRESARFRVVWCAVVGQSRVFPGKVKRYQKDRRSEDLLASSILGPLSRIEDSVKMEGKHGRKRRSWPWTMAQ